MDEGLRIDCHMHLYPTKAAGRQDKATYQIWEYGDEADVAFSKFDGDIEDAEAAISEAGYAHAVVANLFAVDLLPEEQRSAKPADLAEHLMDFNRSARRSAP